MKYSILTLGCKVNQYESEAMMEIFENAGYRKAGEGEKADVYVINTCTVTNLSDQKSRQFVSKAKKENEDSVVAVTGCYSQVDPKAIEALDSVDIILGTKERNRIVELVELFRQTKKKINLVSKLEKDREFEPLTISENHDHTRSYIKVQEGCNMFCTYCIIPYARGPINSRDIDEVVLEAQRLAQKGYKELVLTGIHVASYGKDKGGKYSLIELIEKVSAVDGIERVRLSSLEPNVVTDDFLKRLAAIDEFCDHFHLSLQSGSDEILKKMNRKYDSALYSEKIEKIRNYFPDAGITTDIIVGFPSETEDDFKKSLELSEKLKFSRIHVFRYSPRKGTPAANFSNQVDGNIKKQRSEELIEAGKKIREDFLKTQIGKTYQVLFESYSDGFIEGYSKNYQKVYVKGGFNLLTQIHSVIIKEIKDDGLLAVIKE